MFETITLTMKWPPEETPPGWTPEEIERELVGDFYQIAAEDGNDDIDEEVDLDVDTAPGSLVATITMLDPPDIDILPGFINSLIRRYLQNKLEREARKIGQDAPFDPETSVVID